MCRCQQVTLQNLIERNPATAVPKVATLSTVLERTTARLQFGDGYRLSSSNATCCFSTNVPGSEGKRRLFKVVAATQQPS
jgi:hypothetical protein